MMDYRRGEGVIVAQPGGPARGRDVARTFQQPGDVETDQRGGHETYRREHAETPADVGGHEKKWILLLLSDGEQVALVSVGDGKDVAAGALAQGFRDPGAHDEKGGQGLGRGAGL